MQGDTCMKRHGGAELPAGESLLCTEEEYTRLSAVVPTARDSPIARDSAIRRSGRVIVIVVRSMGGGGRRAESCWCDQDDGRLTVLAAANLRHVLFGAVTPVGNNLYTTHIGSRLAIHSTFMSSHFLLVSCGERAE